MIVLHSTFLSASVIGIALIFLIWKNEITAYVISPAARTLTDLPVPYKIPDSQNTRQMQSRK